MIISWQSKVIGFWLKQIETRWTEIDRKISETIHTLKWYKIIKSPLQTGFDIYFHPYSTKPWVPFRHGCKLILRNHWLNQKMWLNPILKHSSPEHSRLFFPYANGKWRPSLQIFSCIDLWCKLRVRPAV